MSNQVTPNNLILTEIKGEALTDHWPFIERGLRLLCHRLEPDWIPHDVYMQLRMGNANCVLFTRGDRRLAFMVYHRMVRPFSQKSDLFVWAAWNLPIREQWCTDRMEEVISAGCAYLQAMKQAMGALKIKWITSQGRAKAFQRKYKWKPAWVGFDVEDMTSGAGVNGSTIE